VHDLDTTTLPNGRYTLEVLAADTRWNMGANSVSFTVANIGPPAPTAVAPGVVARSRHAE
jgi:hypothetical protein